MKYIVIPILRTMVVIFSLVLIILFVGTCHLLIYIWNLDKDVLEEYKDLVKLTLYEEFHISGKNNYYYKTPTDYILNRKTYNK